MFKAFKRNEKFFNTIKTHPQIDFWIYDRNVYYNNKGPISGSHTNNIYPITGAISLYEMNVDRPAAQYIYPFITKDGSLSSFKTITTSNFNSDFSYGDVITGSYPLEATIQKYHYAADSTRAYVAPLRNTLDHYKTLSPHYAYSSSLGNKNTQEVGLVTIPSIFYGSSIKKGSVKLSFYVTGALIGQLEDSRRNGELIQTLPVGSNGSGSVAGVVLYNEGFMFLTGAWDISNGTHTEPYDGGSDIGPQWTHFASLGQVAAGGGENLPSSSFNMNFKGTSYVSTITMLCNADRGEFNYSNNPTFIAAGQTGSLDAITSSHSYREKDLTVKNITKTPWTNDTGSYDPVTYISKVGIFDKNKNLIAVAKLARPLRKRIDDSFTIKLTQDI